MNLREKVLYHQIHPLKLLADIGWCVPCVWFLWQHQLIAALIVGLLPSIVVSAALIRRADLEWLRQSAAGRYVARYMTRSMEAVRAAGMIGLGIGAWYHMPALMFIGVAVILAAWSRGMPLPVPLNDSAPTGLGPIA